MLLNFTSISCVHRDEYELPTGAIFKSNGLKPDHIYMYIQDDTLSRTVFNYAEKVNIEFSNVEGFNRRDSLAFIGMSTTILQGMDTVYYKPDIFPELDKGTDMTGLDLINYFRAYFPYRDNGAFNLHIKAWDKNGKGTFVFEMPFRICTNHLLHISEGGLDYKTAYFYDEITKESKNDNIFYQDGEMLLYFESLSGFFKYKGRVYPAISVLISDSLGHKLIDDRNILSDFSQSGITPEELNNLFPIPFRLSKGLASPSSNVKIKISDLKSQKYLGLATRIEIKPHAAASLPGQTIK